MLPPKKVDDPKKKPEPAVPQQPEKGDDIIAIDALHPFSHKNQFNKPGNIRKGKKVAEDFKFA